MATSTHDRGDFTRGNGTGGEHALEGNSAKFPDENFELKHHVGCLSMANGRLQRLSVTLCRLKIVETNGAWIFLNDYRTKLDRTRMDRSLISVQVIHPGSMANTLCKSYIGYAQCIVDRKAASNDSFSTLISNNHIGSERLFQDKM